jgi:hypothetical protein
MKGGVKRLLNFSHFSHFIIFLCGCPTYRNQLDIPGRYDKLFPELPEKKRKRMHLETAP